MTPLYIYQRSQAEVEVVLPKYYNIGVVGFGDAGLPMGPIIQMVR